MRRHFSFRVKKSLLSQLAIRTISFSLVFFIPLAFLTMHFQKNAIKQSIKQTAFLVAEGKAAEINPILTQVEHSVSVLEERLLSTLDENRFATDQSYREDYIQRAEDWFEDIARFTPGAATSWFRLEKERYGNTAGVFMTGDRYGGFVSVKPTDLSEYSENDREHVGWYYEPLVAGEPVWMLPYENRNVDIKMITYVIPFYRNGIFLGVVGMDIELAYLKRLVDNIKISNTLAFLMDSNYNLIYHPDYPNGLPSVMYDHEFSQIAAYASTDNNQAKIYKCHWQGVTQHIIFKKLQNGSILGISIEDIVARKARFRISMLSFSLFLTIFVLFYFLVFFISRKIISPISELIEDSRRLSRGELGIIIKYKADNEIGLLADSIRMMEKQLKEYIEYIRKQTESERNAKETAINASRAKSDFLANMSHEIRTPINAVLGMNELILRETENDNIRGYAVNIRNAGNTLLSLINDVLDFSKIEAGKMEIIPVRYDLALLLVDLRVMISERAEQKDLTFELKANPAMPKFLYGDNMRLKQCILNLLTNAVKYTQKGGITFSVDFTFIKDDESSIMLQVSVKDTGIGIKPEDVQKLFAPFERIEEKRNRTIEGTGLGMSIVKRTLDMMGSRLSIESEYGKGSTFSFEVRQKIAENIPLGNLNEAHKKSIAEASHYKEKLYAPKAKILFVDDTPLNLQVVQGLLKHTGITLDTAESGAKTLEKVQQTKYDILFIDHRMPVMDGIETLHAINELPGNKSLGKPCIALTANVISGARELYIKEGFTDYLSKPVVPAELENMIRAYLPPEYIEEVPDSVNESLSKKENDSSQKNTDSEKDIFPKMKGINIESALQNCGSAQLLKEMFTTFYSEIDAKKDLLCEFLKNSDFENYRIKVHALKSESRLIGAIELSEEARMLETAADAKKEEEILEKNPALMEHLLSFKEILKDFAPNNKTSDAKRKRISSKMLDTELEQLEKAAKNFNPELADSVVEKLSGYKLPEDFSQIFENISLYARQMDYINLSKIISEYRMDKKKE
ncbi:hybrid sensor histidine kinase/response regulator [Treponema sp. C6A8]|uniref:hybrid sensor histidine kinase/response regulator n=1 Tax=Treponema sp. C6A8 TaxID=1410609 RepID=UPI0006871F75|nr:hybrid sensor histidine kinase/response regulator [Treponema sp. C6A8]